jgi:hypothetical protein
MNIDEYFKTNNFTNFPCIEQKQDVLTYIISNSVIMRTRLYTLHTNKNKVKTMQKKKFSHNFILTISSHIKCTVNNNKFAYNNS